MRDLICLFLYSIFIELTLDWEKNYIQKKGIVLDKMKKTLISIGSILVKVLLFLGIIFLLEFLHPNLLNLVEI
ncbi:MAG: hypothetical protein PHU94_03170 [Bacilli bacterium]|nr:hypothetical protein [Bacilli bacterium]MDD4733829.1 hypothetical protein [Bacilli bacterium]